MSSGRVCSSSFSFSFVFLFFPPFRVVLDFPNEDFGNVRIAPRVTGAKSSFAIVFTSLLDGVRKSILKASFRSRLGLAAFRSVASARLLR